MGWRLFLTVLESAPETEPDQTFGFFKMFEEASAAAAASVVVCFFSNPGPKFLHWVLGVFICRQTIKPNGFIR